MDVRRINFFAGAGCGKSTISAKVFAALKEKHYDVEHIAEFIKVMAHEGRKPVSFDQVYIFGQQLHAEDVVLRNVKTIVSDSPLLLNASYAVYYSAPGSDNLVKIAQRFEEDFPSVNFMLQRTVPYQTAGRYQTYDQAVKFDDYLIRFLMSELQGEKLNIVKVDEFDKIMDIIEKA